MENILRGRRPDGWPRAASPLPSIVPPLDIASGAIAAYSLRKLRTGYAGACCNVRRSSDSTAQDIGFTAGGDFNLAAFNSFVGGGTGFVVTWYDQSGNGRNVTQAVQARQPTLVTSVATLNGRAGIFFGDAANVALKVAGGIGTIMTTSAGLVSTVYNVTVTPSNNDRFWAEVATLPNQLAFFVIGANTIIQLFCGWTGSTGQLARFQTSVLSGFLGSHTIDVSYQWTLVGNVPTFYWDGVRLPLTVFSAPIGSPGSETGLDYNLGGQDGTTVGFPGHIAEQIVWPSTPANMPAVRVNQRYYWGTP